MIIMRILLQVPAGLKTKAFQFASELEAKGNVVFISCENVYGSCDLREHEARMLNVDKIIHYGHTRFMKSDIPVEYVEYREAIDVLPALEKEIGKIKEVDICLTASLQFIDNIKKVKMFLEAHGKKVVVPNQVDKEKHLYPGQVLGCFNRLPQAEAYLHIGSGNFHALGMKGKVYVLDVERQEIREIDFLEEMDNLDKQIFQLDFVILLRLKYQLQIL